MAHILYLQGGYQGVLRMLEKVYFALAFFLIVAMSGPIKTNASCTARLLIKKIYRVTTKAIRAYAFDIDDNILNMPTKIMLFNKVTGVQVGISTAKFAEVRSTIGKSGDYKDFELRRDIKTGSHRFFGDEMDPTQNNFLKDLKLAIETMPPEKWQGPAWAAFVRALSDPVTAAQSTFITARSNSPQAIYEGLRYLQELGFIKNLPRIENIFPVGYPKFSPRFKGFSQGGVSASSASAMKTEVMKQLLDEIESSPIEPDAPLLMNQDGLGSDRLHTWGFSDDDPGNFKNAVEILRVEFAKGRWPHVKITIFYTGRNSSEPLHEVVIMNDGNLRPRKGKELFFSQ